MRGLRLLSSSSSGGSQSFIERAKLMGANALLGHFTSGGGFDSSLSSLSVTTLSNGHVECEFHVHKHHCNAFGTLHGGCTALLVDVVGTMALLSLDVSRPGVSVEMNQSFLRSVKAGDKVHIEGKVLKTGKRLGYTEVTLFNHSKEIIAIGRHTKAFQ